MTRCGPLTNRCRAWERSDLLAPLAVMLFAPLFLTGGIGRFDFWWWLTFNVVVLVGLAALLDRTFIPHLRADLRERWGWKILGGLASAAVLYGLLGTCKLQGVNGEAWLRDVLVRLPNHPTDRLAELTPRLWKPSAPG